MCTRAYNEANASREQKLYLDDVRVMKHKGECWRTPGSTGPAGAEERQAVEVARRLIYNDAGEYRGDDEAVFLNQIVSDNDTTGMMTALCLVCTFDCIIILSTLFFCQVPQTLLQSRIESLALYLMVWQSMYLILAMC